MTGMCKLRIEEMVMNWLDSSTRNGIHQLAAPARIGDEIRRTTEFHNAELPLDNEGMNVAIGEVKDVENDNDDDFEAAKRERFQEQTEG